MNIINTRIKELRKALGYSQEKFGELLGITKSGVSDIESGRRDVTEKHIIMLKNNNVNEEWLRNGTGEMFQPVNKNDEISRLFGDVLKKDDNNFRHRLIAALAKLDDTGWDELEHLIDLISEKK